MCGCGECRDLVCGWHTWFRHCAYSADVPGMTVVRGMRGVGGLCEMCVVWIWAV